MKLRGERRRSTWVRTRTRAWAPSPLRSRGASLIASCCYYARPMAGSLRGISILTPSITRHTPRAIPVGWIPRWACDFGGRVKRNDLVSRLQRDIPVFLGWVGVALGFEHAQGGDQFGAGVAGLDDGVHPAAFGGDVRVSEALAELRHVLAAQGFRVFCFLKLAPIDDIHRSFRPHHGDFCAGVGQVHIRADVL